jgi:hypothetical protein
MPRYIVFVTVKSDGVGDFTHFEDIIRALTNNHRFDDVNFFLVVHIENRGSRSNFDSLYANLLKRTLALGHQFSFGVKDQHLEAIDIASKYEDDQLGQALREATQAIIISYDKVFSLYEPYLKRNILIKYISEHDSHVNRHDIFVLPDDMCKYPREFMIRGMGLASTPKSHGIKVKEIPRLSTDAAFQVIQTHDPLFLAQALACTKTENHTALKRDNIIIPAYFTEDFSFAYFISILVNNATIHQEKNIIIYHSGTDFNEIYKTRYGSLVESVLTKLPIANIEVFEPGNETPTMQFQGSDQASINIKIFTGFYISNSSYQALYQIAPFAGVSGDNSFELAVSTKTLPFYWSTNAPFKEKLFDALKAISNMNALPLTRKTRDSFGLFFSLCKTTNEELEQYKEIDFQEIILAWPLIAHYIKSYHNFYDKLEAIVCENLPSNSLPAQLRYKYYASINSSPLGFGGLIYHHNQRYAPSKAPLTTNACTIS